LTETIHDTPSNPFIYVFAKILMAGRANGLHVIDGLSSRFATSTRCASGWDLGFA